MATTQQANHYFMRLYNDVWATYDAKAFDRYYDRNITATSGEHSFCFEQFHELLANNPNRFAYMRPIYHRIEAINDNTLLASFTTNHYDADNQLALKINTMGRYVIEDDKVRSVDFVWDQPISKVLADINCRTTSVYHLLPTALQALTLCELHCFFYLIQGKPARAIGKIVHRSTRTIESHIANIKCKLQLPTTAAVIEFAYHHNLISLSPLLSKLIETGNQHD